MKYHRLITAALAEAWAMEPRKLAAIADFLALKAEGVRFTREEIEVRTGVPFAISPGRSSARRDVRVLPVRGIISHRMRLMDDISGPGGTSTEELGHQLDDALDDPGIGTVLLDIDSPGGTVTGVPELADRIHAARGGDTRIIAQVNALAASAAYWLASQADEIVITPSGSAGSIGVYTLHENHAGELEQDGIEPTLISAGKYKTEGHPFGPLGDEARAALQERVDTYYTLFVDAVARGRGVSPERVRTGYGEGRTLTARAALDAGLVDRIAPLDDTLNQLLGPAPSSAPTSKTPVARLLRALDHL